MNFDTRAEAALNLAKSALDAGQSLDAGRLLEALYHSTDIKQRLPGLSDYLNEPTPKTSPPPATVKVEGSLRPVLGQLSQLGRAVTPDDLFIALIESPAGREFLKTRGLADNLVHDALALLRNNPKRHWKGSAERADVIARLQPFGKVLTDGLPPHPGLTGRDQQMRALVGALSKMKRRNAMIIGFPRTGKTALVYELARRIVGGDAKIPAHLLDSDVFELWPSALKAGASVVGQYEERVNKLLAALRDAHLPGEQQSRVILFVDEIHSLLQSGIHERGPYSDANESFKAALGHGEITCVGCTTLAEYRHHIQPDQALADRFTTIRLEPPSTATTLEILGRRKPQLAAHYLGLTIPDAVLPCAVSLTDEYLPASYQPDKSIQLLDEACACCVTADPPVPELSEEILLRVLEDRLGYPVGRRIQFTEQSAYDPLRAKIVGQDDVLREIARSFVAGMGGWRRSKGPRGVFLFAGPTGVGKTKAAVELARLLGGGKELMVRVDCNTLQGSGLDSGPAIHRLLGVPPGYVGYSRGQGGVLSRIRDTPESVVLFDEFEKADPGVGEILLRIIDEGKTEDTDGNLLDFRRSFVVFTTNAGSSYDHKGQIGFGHPSRDEAENLPHTDEKSLRRELVSLGLGEEFLGRIDHTFIFRALGRDHIGEVLRIRLADLQRDAAEKGLALTWADELIPALLEDWQPRHGARALTNTLRNRITAQLGLASAQGELEGATEIRLTTSGAQGRAPHVGRERCGDTLVITVC